MRVARLPFSQGLAWSREICHAHFKLSIHESKPSVNPSANAVEVAIEGPWKADRPLVEIVGRRFFGHTDSTLLLQHDIGVGSQPSEHPAPIWRHNSSRGTTAFRDCSSPPRRLSLNGLARIWKAGCLTDERPRNSRPKSFPSLFGMNKHSKKRSSRRLFSQNDTGTPLLNGVHYPSGHRNLNSDRV